MSEDDDLNDDPYDTGKYILVNREPVHTKDLLGWAKWLEEADADRIVKQENIGPYHISTVFLGLDYNHARFWGRRGSDYRPILFETMAFHTMGHEKRLTVQERCSTWAEAEEQHARIAAEFTKAISG